MTEVRKLESERNGVIIRDDDRGTDTIISLAEDGQELIIDQTTADGDLTTISLQLEHLYETLFLIEHEQFGDIGFFDEEEE